MEDISRFDCRCLAERCLVGGGAAGYESSVKERFYPTSEAHLKCAILAVETFSGRKSAIMTVCTALSWIQSSLPGLKAGSEEQSLADTVCVNSQGSRLWLQ